MKLKDLCRSADISVPAAFRELEIREIVTDSRLATKGCMLICINGLHTDGHAYIEQAVLHGAVCILAQEGHRPLPPLSEHICLLSAKDTRRAAACLFNQFYGDPVSKLKFIGVTGTNGKTSVTHMLRAVLEAALCPCGLVGTVGCESAGRRLDSRSGNALANMTTPDPPELYRLLAQMQADGVEYVIMEVTSHALSLGKLEPILFDVGIFTNLTPDHLDFHKSMEAYAEAKSRLFQKCRLAILNADDPWAGYMQSAAIGRCVTCGISKSADYIAEIKGADLLGGVAFDLRSGSSCLRLQCPIPGRFTVTNAMQAAVCAMELGIGASAIKTAMSSLTEIKGRMERLRLGVEADFSVIIDYAHTPDALEKLLCTAREMRHPNGRLIILFGCGGDRDRSKRPIMGGIAEQYADKVVLTADNSRSEDPLDIIREIRSGMKNGEPTVIPDRKEAIRQVVLTAKPHDLILLAGKGHEEYEINRNGRFWFCEKEIVQMALKEKLRQSAELPPTVQNQTDEGVDRQA